MNIYYPWILSLSNEKVKYSTLIPINIQSKLLQVVVTTNFATITQIIEKAP